MPRPVPPHVGHPPAGAATPPAEGLNPPSARRAGGARGRATVARLMDAARDAISSRGVTGMRIDDVAERAGTSHGTLYLYFEDKDDLLDALVTDCQHELTRLAARTPTILPANSHAVVDWTLATMQAVRRHCPSIQAALGSRPDFELTALTQPLRAAVLRRLDSRDHLDPSAVVEAWIGMVVWHGMSDLAMDVGAKVATELLMRGTNDGRSSASGQGLARG